MIKVAEYCAISGCWYGFPTAGGALDESCFKLSSNRRDSCKIGALFEVKKEIRV